MDVYNMLKARQHDESQPGNYGQFISFYPVLPSTQSDDIAVCPWLLVNDIIMSIVYIHPYTIWYTIPYRSCPNFTIKWWDEPPKCFFHVAADGLQILLQTSLQRPRERGSRCGRRRRVQTFVSQRRCSTVWDGWVEDDWNHMEHL